MPDKATDYLLVEVTRGGMVESRHNVSLAVVNAAGDIILQAGDINQLIYARSGIKPLQALALVESGAAEAFELSNAELALACASHNAEPRHVETVTAWLTRIGLSTQELECGAHLPLCQQTAKALLEVGEIPSVVHNNCSGKHAGFLTIARHLGLSTSGYIRLEHPVQQQVLSILEAMTGLDLKNAPQGIDGCGIPVLGMPLWRIAIAMARFAMPYDQPKVRQRACQRIHQAMAAEPFMVAGTGRFCTRVMELTGKRALIKVGAEGVYCAAFPEAGLGAALKVADGAWRAAEVAMGHVLLQLSLLSKDSQVADAINPKLKNHAGVEVGEVRTSQNS